MNRTRLPVFLFAALALTGCGNKGPLVRPTEPVESTPVLPDETAPATDATPAGQAPQPAPATEAPPEEPATDAPATESVPVMPTAPTTAPQTEPAPTPPAAGGNG